MSASVNPARHPMGEWVHQALCRDADPDMFFVNPGEDTLVQDAKALCRICPVAEDCLDYALRNRIDHGIWGGMSPNDRRRLTRKVA